MWPVRTWQETDVIHPRWSQKFIQRLWYDHLLSNAFTCAYKWLNVVFNRKLYFITEAFHFIFRSVLGVCKVIWNASLELLADMCSAVHRIYILSCNVCIYILFWKPDCHSILKESCFFVVILKFGSILLILLNTCSFVFSSSICSTRTKKTFQDQ